MIGVVPASDKKFLNTLEDGISYGTTKKHVTFTWVIMSIHQVPPKARWQHATCLDGQLPPAMLRSICPGTLLLYSARVRPFSPSRSVAQTDPGRAVRVWGGGGGGGAGAGSAEGRIAASRRRPARLRSVTGC